MSFAYTEPQQRMGDIQTPPWVADFLYDILKHLKPDVVLDPCCGIGNLLHPWRNRRLKHHVIGIEKNPELWKEFKKRDPKNPVVLGENKQFEECKTSEFMFYMPQLVLCNPPWNRHWKKLNYPEVFLRKIVELFGNQIPVAFLCPMGFRLNQELTSSRWKWLRDTMTISSIISCPRNLYPDTEFHSEIILFNCRRVKPHYWLPEPPQEWRGLTTRSNR